MAANTTPRSFATNAVLGLVTSRLLGDFNHVHELVEFMAGEPIWTHQLPRVCGEIIPVILRQHPQLAPVVEEGAAVTKDNWQQMLADWIDRFGDTIALVPMTVDDHESIEPVSELAEKIHPSRIFLMGTKP